MPEFNAHCKAEAHFSPAMVSIREEGTISCCSKGVGQRVGGHFQAD